MSVYLILEMRSLIDGVVWHLNVFDPFGFE